MTVHYILFGKSIVYKMCDSWSFFNVNDGTAKWGHSKCVLPPE